MRTQQEDKILKEIEKLVDAGVKIHVGGGCNSDRYDSGFTEIHNDKVHLTIGINDSLDTMIDNIIKAGVLVDKLIEINNHEKQHPNLLKAIEARIK